MRVGVFGAAVALVLAGAGPGRAAESGTCADFKWPVTREVAALGAADLPTLATGVAYPGLGQGVAVALAPQADVAYSVKPARAPKANPAYGAQLVLADAPGGAIQVTLSDDAWVDVVQNGRVLRSTAFSGKTGCAAVRKSVRFSVEPGPVTIDISDAPAPTIRLDVVPAE